VYSTITRLVHHYDHLPIELVCYLITGTSGADEDITYAYSDASWKMRHKLYDTMTPEEIRAAARSQRNGNQLRAFEDLDCSALAIIASEGSTAYNRMHASLQLAADRARKRKLAALEDDMQPHANAEAVAALEDITHSDVESAHDDDMLAALGC
jgi:hypothetical protein